MSAKAIYESDAKRILFDQFKKFGDLIHYHKFETIQCVENEPIDYTSIKHAFRGGEKLIVKPDQLIKRRGKLNLILLDATINACEEWIKTKANKEITINNTTGKLKRFIIEPFCVHKQNQEHYIAITSSKNGDEIMYYEEGGINVGDVDEKASKIFVEIDQKLTCEILEPLFSPRMDNDKKKDLTAFIINLYTIYQNLYFTYLEINPLVYVNRKFHILDIAAKLDQTANYLCARLWGGVAFPPPFGRNAYPEEKHVHDIDAKSGASLKLTILNPYGSIWTMVAGGGASVIYTDTICDLGGSEELANYGEYSGAPSEFQTYDYAKTILGLMTKYKSEKKKILIIGGGIANFTNVASTFKGIGRALQSYRQDLISHEVSIFVRRGGPNYQQGLRYLNTLSKSLGVYMRVFGPEVHMTAIVSMALNKIDISLKHFDSQNRTAKFLLPSTDYLKNGLRKKSSTRSSYSDFNSNELFHSKTKAIIWGMQNKSVQRMIDFDYVCRRDDPSVVAIVYPMTDNHFQKFYWGHKEILIPVYKNMNDAVLKYKKADVLINYASLRSAYESTIEAMTHNQFRTIIIIAEGIPENLSRKLAKVSKENNVSIIGPATVGGIKPGCFKIGNSGGMLDNILSAKLYRPGCVAYVSRSGGMSNELNNIISKNTNGVYEGIAIGGDRYPSTTYWDHIKRYNENDDIKMIVLLGEVGGTLEYEVIEKLKLKIIEKPLIAWCIGTCTDKLNSEVQFGHAGSLAHANYETATAKNEAFRAAGAIVPTTFDSLDVKIKEVYTELLNQKIIVESPEIPPPTVPMDYSWAQELGIIRKPASFTSTITDERGQELLYCGMPITEIIDKDMGLGGVLGLLWFQKRLPSYACKYLEMCLMLTADHGPAVSGAHNTIVCARAGKDLISCLCSGLLTIGEKFGGALNGAAKQFSNAFDTNLLPTEFVNQVRREGKLIMGIGHRVKSVNNPDKRVSILKDYVFKNFNSTELLEYAIKVEQVTTAKKSNLILNVDGCIAVTMVDLLRSCGCFTSEESQNYVQMGCLNSLFVLGRSIGFIGHFMDQRRLKQDLYRHPWDDITYVMPEVYEP